MDLLEKYYNEEFKHESDPEFKTLSSDHKKTLEDTLGFQQYKLGEEITKAYEEFKQSIFNSIDNRFYLWIMKMYFKFNEMNKKQLTEWILISLSIGVTLAYLIAMGILITIN